MKILKSLFFWFFVFILGANIFLANYYFSKDFKLNQLVKIVAPLPSYLVNSLYKEAQASNIWLPGSKKLTITTKPLALTAKGAISYDLTTDTLIYAKNENTKLPIASLTKIMTAIIALENMNLKDNLTVTKSAASIGEDSMGLSEGEKIAVEDLLYGLMLNSGNDAAETLAQGSKFTKSNFVYLMNKKAEDLGLADTHYTNPSGLQGDGQQYSTAKDLLVITRYALNNPKFAEIVSTYEHDMPQETTHKAYILYNETNLLTTYKGVKGVKTGFTDEAGMCLVTYLDYGGHRIIAVLLNSENRRQEMKDLLDFSLQNLGITPPGRI